MMYYYNVGWTGYEDAICTQFTHEEEYSEEQLREIVKSCIEEAVILDRIEGLEYWEEYHPNEKVPDHFGFSNDFSNIYPHIITIMIEKLGFKELKFQASFYEFEYNSGNSSKDVRDLIHAAIEKVKADEAGEAND